MNVLLAPASWSGTVTAIPSKSAAHRLLIAAALADRPTEIRIAGTLSEDIDATCAGLRALGTRIDATATGLAVQPPPPARQPVRVNCHESGSTLRFLLPLLAHCCPAAEVSGEGRLPGRPLGELLTALREHGATCTADTLPLRISGPLRPGDFNLPGNVSSQYISGLMFVLPLLDADSRIILTTPLESAPYVDLTRECLELFSIRMQAIPGGWLIPGRQAYRSPGELQVEGDWSNAAVFLAAGAIGPAPVTLRGLRPDSRQGDRRILQLLQNFGAVVSQTAETITVSPAPLHGQEIDLREVPDLLPVLAIVAAAATGETRFVQAARLRLKESDRLASVASLLRALGGEVDEWPDALTVHGQGRLRGGETEDARDHRLVMAAALASLRAREPILIRGFQAINKSYPTFLSDITQLGGHADVI